MRGRRPGHQEGAGTVTGGNPAFRKERARDGGRPGHMDGAGPARGGVTAFGKGVPRHGGCPGLLERAAPWRGLRPDALGKSSISRNAPFPSEMLESFPLRALEAWPRMPGRVARKPGEGFRERQMSKCLLILKKFGRLVTMIVLYEISLLDSSPGAPPSWPPSAPPVARRPVRWR